MRSLIPKSAPRAPTAHHALGRYSTAVKNVLLGVGVRFFTIELDTMGGAGSCVQVL